MVAVTVDASTSVEKKKKTRRGNKKTRADGDREMQTSDRSGDESGGEEAFGAGSVRAAPADVEMAVDHFNNATVSWADVQPDDAGLAEDDDAVMIDTTTADSVLPTAQETSFPPLPASALQTIKRNETRKIAIPPHRMTPLKKDWVNIFTPLTEMAGLQVRMNIAKKAVEIRVRLANYN